MASINVRIEADTKRDAETLFNELGFTMSAAINVFLKQAIREKGIPFEITLNTPNETTIKAIEQGQKISKDKKKGFTDIKSLRKALDV